MYRKVNNIAAGHSTPPDDDELKKWCDMCPEVTEEEATAIDIENPATAIQEFRDYCEGIGKMKYSSWMIAYLKDKCGHSVKRAKVRVMMRFGWFPGWTNATAKARLMELVNAGQSPIIGLSTKDTKSWKNIVCTHNPPRLPSPLPYIPNELIKLDSALLQEEKRKRKEKQLKKVKSKLTDKEAWDWAKDHMEVEWLTLDECPDGVTFALYKIARKEPKKFMDDHFKRWGKVQAEDKETSAKKRWLEDDMRTRIGLVTRLKEEWARICAAVPSPHREQS